MLLHRFVSCLIDGCMVGCSVGERSNATLAIDNYRAKGADTFCEVLLGPPQSPLVGALALVSRSQVNPMKVVALASWAKVAIQSTAHSKIEKANCSAAWPRCPDIPYTFHNNDPSWTLDVVRSLSHLSRVYSSTTVEHPGAK